MTARQAILTRILPCTEKKPTRIKASCKRGGLTVSIHFARVDAANHQDEKHAIVARMLCEVFDEEDTKKHGGPLGKWTDAFVTGVLPNGDHCHVFLT